MAQQPLDAVRILVVGDSGVGKSTLVRLLASEASLGVEGDEACTVGVNLAVRLQAVSVGGTERVHFVELIDVGGHCNHALSRSVYYHKIHGILLVYDLSNRKSLSNLRKWLAELRDADAAQPLSSKSRAEGVRSRQVGCGPESKSLLNGVPILAVGTKRDMLPGGTLPTGTQPAHGIDNINLCAIGRGASHEAERLVPFIEHVIIRSFYDVQNGAPTTLRATA